MRIEHPFPWGRIARTLESTPVILKELVRGISDAEADFHPDPERMTIREVIPHLAGWEPVFLAQMRRTCTEDRPLLGDDNHKAPMVDSPEIMVQLEVFAERRSQTVEFLRTLSMEAWGREAMRSTYGPTTVDALAFMAVMHDTYHTRQIVEWRELFRTRS